MSRTTGEVAGPSPGLDDTDLTDDATAEQIFGFDLVMPELGRLAEETTKSAAKPWR